jgi:hypothetical protein
MGIVGEFAIDAPASLGFETTLINAVAPVK